MGRTKYDSAKKMLEGLNKIISMNCLRQEIMINLGCDERTIQSSMKIMLETKLIKDIGEGKFEIL